MATFLAKTGFLTVAVFATSIACSTNIYKPLATQDSEAAQKEEALMALDSGNYAKAEPILQKLWSKNKSSEISQLYAVSMLGSVGLDIFSVISNAMSSCSGDECSGNGLMSQLSSALPSNINREQAKEKLKNSVEVLKGEEVGTATSPLLCFAGGIYSNFVIEDLQTQIEEIQTTLKTDLESLPTACQGGSADVEAVGAKVQSSVTQLGEIATNLKEVTSTVGACLSQVSSGSENGVQEMLSKFETNADKGCVLPPSGTIGQLPMPACMADFVTAGATASAGDGRVDGCELFINCATGECF